MYINLETSDKLFKRQLYGNYFKPFNFSDQIMISIFASSKCLFESEKNFYRTLHAHCFSEDGNLLATGDCNVWKLDYQFVFNEKFKLTTLKFTRRQFKEILFFNNDSTKLLANKSSLKRGIIVNDLVTLKLEKEISLEHDLVDISKSPYNPALTALFCKDNFYFLDLRSSSAQKINKTTKNVTSFQYHPIKDYLFLVTSNEKNEIYTFDTRNLKPTFHYNTICDNPLSNPYARYNRNGDKIFVIRSNMNPILFYSDNSYPAYEFDEINYINTLDPYVYRQKCCFVGPNDEYVVTGSNNKKAYVWEIPKKNNHDNELIKVNSAKFVLKHQKKPVIFSYNYQRSIIACSARLGNEINFWSPLLLSTENVKKIPRPKWKSMSFTKFY